MHAPQQFVSIALPVPLRQNYEYAVSSSTQIAHSIELGMRAKVPFRERELIGIIVDIYSTPRSHVKNVKSVIEIIDIQPCIPGSLLVFYQWASIYYQHSFGEVLSCALPKSLRQGLQIEPLKGWQLTTDGKGLSESSLDRAPKQQQIVAYLMTNQAIPDSDLHHLGLSRAALKSLNAKGLIKLGELSETNNQLTPESLLNQKPLALNQEQQEAYNSVAFHRFGCYLLNGVTGSGKTEVYLHLISRVLLSNRQVLVLVPEIGLTHQTIQRIQQRFKCSIAQQHSNVGEKERGQQWVAARDGKAQIVIGTRLSALTPIKNLGLIVVDEEHDSSYKQQDGFRYSARDISIYRAHTLKIPIVLGSATPSLESLHNVSEGKYTELKLNRRAGVALMPNIKTIDMRGEHSQAGLASICIERIDKTLMAKMQALVFINRRGFAPLYQCQQCGWRAQCTACSNSLTLHTNPRKLVCHHCGRQQHVPRQCPSCGNDQLVSTGTGTEQVEAYLKRQFSQYSVIRIDRDTTRKKDALRQQLETINNGEPCVLVGTQMLAKGHHLPNLNLIVIVDIDQGLFSADFRSSERMGQTLTQVAGRAGREEKPGNVLIQTHYPDHPLLSLLLDRGYQAFSERLLTDRKSTHLPPYWHQAVFKAESKHIHVAVEFIMLAKSTLAKIRPKSETTQYLGPIPDAIERVNNRYRILLRITCINRTELQELLKEGIKIIDQQALAKRTRWSVDVDAY